MAKARTAEEKWKRQKTWLRERFPLHRPVMVVRTTRLIDGCKLQLGRCMWEPRVRRGMFHITIRCNVAYYVMVESLQHEWVHARVQPLELLPDRAVDIEDHHDEYWLEYGRIYRAWEEEEEDANA